MLGYHRDIAKRHKLLEPWYAQLIFNFMVSLFYYTGRSYMCSVMRARPFLWRSRVLGSIEV
jgi:hypothetical protein